MALPAAGHHLVTTEQLLEETAVGLALLEIASEAIRNGKVVEAEDVWARSERYQDIKTNKVFQAADKLRGYGYEDRPCHVLPHETFNLFGFVFALRQLVDFFDVGTIEPCNAVLQTAYARDKLNSLDPRRGYTMVSSCDHHEDVPDGLALGLTIHEVSLLTGLEEQSIRNELSRDKAIPRSVGKDSGQVEIPLDYAATWLLGKGRFRVYQPPRSNNHLSVPVANDGSFFHAGLKRTKGYTIGKKGDERPIKEFRKALAELEKMPKPYWRRPSKTTGVPGIVKGVRWESKTPEELGLD